MSYNKKRTTFNAGMKAVLYGMVCAAALAASASCGEGETLRDCVWLWGHESGQIDGPKSAWGLPPFKVYYHQAQACRDFGVPNLCCIRWDMPKKDFRDSLAGLRRVTFPASSTKGDARSYSRLLNWDFDVAREMPNMVGIDFDDFFRAAKAPQPTAYTVDELKDIRRRAAAFGRPFELRVIAYELLFLRGTGHSHARENPAAELSPYFEQFDKIMFWVWMGRNIKKLPTWFDELRKVSCGKPILLGLYLWDFGGTKKELLDEDMKFQLDFALEKWKTGEIDGVVFLATSICNRDFAAVRMAREWIRANAELTRCRPQRGASIPQTRAP